jgi:hypothetical protein
MEREVTDDKRTERQRRDAEIEAKAAEAYDDLHNEKKGKNDWASWMRIADGLMVGRRWALERSGQQEPKGKGYNMAFSQWMAARHWARDLAKPDRLDCIWCAENRTEIEEWRDELPSQERLKKNHPTHMKRAYLKAHPPAKTEEEGEESETKKRRGKPDEEALREELFQLRGLLAVQSRHFLERADCESLRL